MGRCLTHSFVDERKPFSSRNHTETVERQQNFDGAREIKSVKAPRLWMVYKLEMLDFHSKNVAVILTEDATGNQEKKKKKTKLKSSELRNFKTKFCDGTKFLLK